MTRRRNIAVALLFAGVFAAVDLYVCNVSSYLAGALLAYLILEGRQTKRESLHSWQDNRQSEIQGAIPPGGNKAEA